MPALFSDDVSAGHLLLLLSYSYCHKAEVLACFWWLSTQVRLSIYRDIPSYNVCSHLHIFMVIAGGLARVTRELSAATQLADLRKELDLNI